MDELYDDLTAEFVSLYVHKELLRSENGGPLISFIYL
jgi:hypothetical protein